MTGRPHKLARLDQALAGRIADGMTLGIGGFGLDRKPMALVHAIAAARPRNLTIETYAGGFDVECLLAAEAVACVSSCHVGLDQFGLAPLFRTAREEGRIVYREWSEFSQLQAWRAAADKAAFAVVDMDPKSGLLAVNSSLKRMASPFGGRDVVVAQAPEIDLAILHVEAAHPEGWAVAAGDPYLDTVLARAARHVIISAERLIDDSELEARSRETHLLASYVDAVVLAPHGALPGSCLPAYMIDLPPILAYCQSTGLGPAAMVDVALATLQIPEAK